VTFTRAELLWLAFLWLADQYRLGQVRLMTSLLDKAYREWGQKMWALALRPSPTLARMRAG
jgi:hypothetical protein